MIDRLTWDGESVCVHLAAISLKATKTFTHGSVVFDLGARTATFGKLPAVAIPKGLTLTAGDQIEFKLVAPDGNLRRQVRAGVLKALEKQPEILRMAGMAQTARRFAAEDGWGTAIYKFRAYFTHPGLKTDGELPEWLKESIRRQTAFWNRLAWLCREARHKCSPVAVEEIAAFVRETILPEIDAMNYRLGRARTKEKMKHPAKLKREDPGLDGLWKFTGELRGRMEKGRAVPEGLLDKVVEFAERYKADYTPLNEFLKAVDTIAERESAALRLRRFEILPTITAFKATLERRRTTKVPWSEGWPMIKYPDRPKAANWGLHYYFNKAGVEAALLETDKGVPGLTLGTPLKPAHTGHPELVGKRAWERRLRAAQISISGKQREKWNFSFALMQHRTLPANSHIKEWKLIFQDGKLWLCLVVELQRPLPAHTALVAGLEIGWRRTEEGIRLATLYEPATKTIREVTIDLQRSPKDSKDRTLFRIDLGPTRWDKRNIALLFPDWKPGDGIPSAIETRMALAARRDYEKDTAKILLRKHLGERAPAWLEKAGSNGLHRLAQEFMEDAAVQEIVNGWQKKNRQIGEVVALYFSRSTKRIEYGQAQVAHDLCHYLKEKKIARLIVESKFLAKISQQHDNEDPESLKRSQKYRQFAAPAKFVALLKNTAVKYGIAVDEHKNVNITRICQHCNHLNPATKKEKFNCEGCGREINQDHNTAINLSRFGSDQELAEMALHAGRVA